MYKKIEKKVVGKMEGTIILCLMENPTYTYKMSSTSKKHRNFVAEPMRGKRVTELPGIGETLGERLSARGYGRADQVLGEYLVSGRNRDRFGGFLRENCNANSKQISDCYNGLDAWSRDFV